MHKNCAVSRRRSRNATSTIRRPAKDAPVGFRAIRLHFDLDTDAAAEQKKKLVELTERYCVVLQTLRGAPPVVTSAG